MFERLCSPCLSQMWRRARAKLPRRGLLKIYLLIYMNMFSFGFSVTMLFPYLPFLTEFLIPRLQEDGKDVGNYIGFIAGSMFLGRVFGSYFWGVISDLKGRKPVLVVSTICMALSTLLFGFSVNFTMAIVSRFLMGFANGLISTSKAVVSEISDDSNQAFGITIVATAMGSGYIIGPAVAGAIADPVGQYNLTITNPFLHSFLTKFPYSLPPFVSTLLFVLSSVLTFFFLPETLGLKKSRKRSEIDQAELAAFRSRLGHTDAVDHLQNSSQTSLCEEEEGTDETRLLGGEELDDSENRTSNLFISNPAATTADDTVAEVLSEGEEQVTEERGREEAKLGMRWEEEEEEEEHSHIEAHNSNIHLKKSRRLSSFLSALKSPLLDLRLFLCDCTSLNSLLIYCVLSFGAISYFELFPLWAYTQPHLGGLGFSLHQISISLTIVGVLMLPVNLLAFPLLEKWLHSIKTFYLVIISLVALFLLMPHIHYLVSHKALLWCSLVAFSFLINAALTVGFSCTIMFINNSATLDKLGSINGVAVMMTSVTRTVAPVVFGSLFSASLSDATLAFGFPVNYNLVFVVLSIVCMTTVFMVACLPVSINKQKIIEDL